MALDAILLSGIIAELRPKIIGARIDKVQQPERDKIVLSVRGDESMRLLKNNPELNISEISDRLGFSTTQYFSKCFKSVFGMAPLTFRKSNPAAPDTSV